MGWVQVTLPNNLFLNLYFENPTIELHILYILNIYANFHANRYNLLFEP